MAVSRKDGVILHKLGTGIKGLEMKIYGPGRERGMVDVS